MTKRFQLNIEILKALRASKPYAQPEETLFMQVGILMPGRVLRSEFDEAIRELETRRAIVGVPGELGGETRWSITADGSAVLAEARQ